MTSQDKFKNTVWMVWLGNPRIAVPVEQTDRTTRYCAHCCREIDEKIPLWVIQTNVESERLNEKANWTCCQTCLTLDVFPSALCDNWVFIDERGLIYDKNIGIRNWSKN